MCSLVQGSTILRTVFSALGKYLDAFRAFVQINMYLAILAVKLLFAAHPAVAQLEAVSDASSFQPRLSPHFDAQRQCQEPAEVFSVEGAIGDTSKATVALNCLPGSN